MIPRKGQFRRHLIIPGPDCAIGKAGALSFAAFAQLDVKSLLDLREGWF